MLADCRAFLGRSPMSTMVITTPSHFLLQNLVLHPSLFDHLQVQMCHRRNFHLQGPNKVLTLGPQ